jgi:hypothetical protein
MNKRLLMAVCMITATEFAIANMPADNVAWSARPAQIKGPARECTAYTGRGLMQDTAPPLLDQALATVGKALVTGALSAAGGYNGSVPNPCAHSGL